MSQSPSILIFQDHLSTGGAARAANRWADVLRKKERHVVQVAGDQSFGATRLLTGKPSRGWGRLVEAFTGKGRRKERVQAGIKAIIQGQQLKAIWFHNIAGGGKWGWSEQMLSLARQYAPVVWTLHDMWALGDSSESYWAEGSVVESGRWKGGRNGKREVEKPKGSRVVRVFGAEGKYPVTLTAPSKWLADLTHKMTGFDCVHLPNPIDLDVFCPGDRANARRQLGLPEKGLVVLAGADSLQDPRKGFDLLQEAWAQFGPSGTTLALFGRHGEAKAGQVYLGSLSKDEELVAAFRASDLYVHPARLENAPCTIQESLACGTPALAFAVGGIPEMVIPDKTGYLVPMVTPASLQAALRNILTSGSHLLALRPTCRAEAQKLFDSRFILNRFEELCQPVGF